MNSVLNLINKIDMEVSQSQGNISFYLVKRTDRFIELIQTELRNICERFLDIIPSKLRDNIVSVFDRIAVTVSAHFLIFAHNIPLLIQVQEGFHQRFQYFRLYPIPIGWANTYFNRV